MSRWPGAYLRGVLRVSLAVAILVTLLLGVDHRVSQARRATPAPAPHPAARYLVVIVLDGARPSYLTLPGLPHVQALLQHGTQYTNAWTGILESETPSGHAAIATGSEPRLNGIPGFGWANQDNTVVSLFSPAAIRSGAMERYMRAAGAPTIAQLYHRRHPRGKVVALSGFKYYAADALGGPDADVIMYYVPRRDHMLGPTFLPGHEPPAGVFSAPGIVGPLGNNFWNTGDSLALSLAGATFQRMHQHVTLINVPGFDWPLGHVYGANLDSRDVGWMMRRFDADLGRLEDVYRRAGVLHKTLFVLTADHGLAPLIHHVPKNVIADAVLKAGTTIARETYHTGTYLWLRTKSKTAAAARNVVAINNPYIQSVYYRQWTRHGPVFVQVGPSRRSDAPGIEAAHQYLLRTFAGPNAPDLAIFFTEGAAGVGKGQEKWKGDHGGADWESQQVPLVFSGPGIRRGYVSSYPARLIDVAPTALTDLGIDPAGMQGLPLADALLVPPAGSQARQQATGRVLVPLITALQQQAATELRAGR